MIDIEFFAKMFEIFPFLDTGNNETKINEFWNWFELLAFILTVKQSEVNHRWTLRKSNSDTEVDIFGLISSFFLLMISKYVMHFPKNLKHLLS